MNPKDVLRWIAFAAAYFAFQALPTTLYGDSPAMRGANAVAVFVLLLEPRRNWPVLVPLLWLAAGAGRLIGQGALPWLLGACNVAEIFAVAAVLHGRGGLSSPWYGRDQLWRLLLAACGVPLLSAAIAAVLLQDRAGLGFGPQWLAWYLASALGYLVLTPMLLTWTNAELRGRLFAQTVQLRWAGMLLLALTCVLLLRQELYAPLLLLSFPLVVLGTWWYGLHGATVLIAVLAITGGFFAGREVGALSVVLAPGSGLPERIQALQLYLAATLLCGLPFAVLLSEQRLLWAELRRRSDARAEFLAAMSHEIRTPMTGVLGMADLLAVQELTPDQRRYVDAMRASGRHLLSVINDILDFSRIESGKLPLEVIAFDLREVIEQIGSLIHPMAHEKRLVFHAQLAPGTPVRVCGDPTRLRQVLLNLSGNAVKFTTRGRVELDVDGAADADGNVRLRFAVRDTGVGIPPDKLQHLFTAFSQADRSTAREFGGSGLGLAISRRLAEAMGGSITVASTPGVGSVFTLEVSLAADAPVDERADAAPPVAAVPARILIAEDVAINRDILAAFLGARGHHVVFAHDGAAALARVQEEAFDLVLMDVQMPVMDGVEATRRIRRLRGDVRAIPIVGLTANVMSQEQASYLGAGMDDCLAKPIEWDRLDAVIARFGPERSGIVPAAVSVTSVQVQVAAVVMPMPDPAPRPHHDVPLVEPRQLASLRDMADASEFAMLMRNGMDAVERTIADIVAAVDTQATASAAHRLKGSAGMMGMARISALAAALEAACGNGDEVDTTHQHLLDLLKETRDALQQSGALAP